MKITIAGVLILLLFMTGKFVYAENQSRHIKIFVHASDFKTAISDELVDKLKTDKVELFTIGELSEKGTGDFDRVIIINQTQWLKPNKSVVKYVESLSTEDKKKVVVLSTAGSKGKNIKVPGIDAMTSASEMNKVDELVNEIVNRLN